MPLCHRLGFCNLNRDAHWQFHRDGQPVIGFQIDFDSIDQKHFVVTDHIGMHGDLFIGVRLHKVKAFAVLIQKVIFAVIHIGLFHHFRGAPPFGHLYPVRNAAHIDRRGGRAFAGVKVLSLEDGVKFTLHFDNIAFPQAGRDDFHRRFPCVQTLARIGPRRIGIAFTASKQKSKAEMTKPHWWTKARHTERRHLLIARNRIQSMMRVWLTEQGFTEVDPAALAISPGNEAHLHGFATDAIGNDGQALRMYLHTSPEFAMKKLLAAGETQIAAFAHVFRNRERGALHSPEFTMLEWYRVGADYTALMADVVDLIRLAAKTAGADHLQFRGKTCDPFAPAERLSLAEAFLRYAKIDLMATIGVDGAVSAPAMAAACAEIGLRTAPDDTWSDMLSRILGEWVEPHLGMGRITILDHYPAHEAALARKLPEDPRLAERFEVYACGVELANGFGELTDPTEQRHRFGLEMAEKQRVYGESYPLDEEFLSALAQMPPSAGIAMGFDRVVMLALGAPRIDDVIWAPVPE